jgi:hypothetical protein
MSNESRRNLLTSFIERANAGDWDGVEKLVHPDYEEVYPQSGEHVRGPKNARAIIENYPGGNLTRSAEAVVSAEDQWVVTPASTILRIDGQGDVWTVVQKARYPDGSDWHIVQIVEFQQDRIARVQSYFAPDFPPPEWRAQWVEVDRGGPPS